jgi:hypothetical protein
VFLWLSVIHFPASVFGMKSEEDAIALHRGLRVSAFILTRIQYEFRHKIVEKKGNILYTFICARLEIFKIAEE